MKNERVSIIIPVYNKDAYLAECLESVRVQTWNNLEVILVDDGSTDSSREIIWEYVRLDSRFRAIWNSHKGPSAARNTGLAAATGTFVTFVDADDMIEPDYIGNMAAAIGSAGLCLTGFKVWHQKENLWKVYTHPPAELVLSGKGESLIRHEDLLGGVAWKLFRTRVVRENGICFPEEIRFGEDTIFFFRYLVHVQKIAVLHDALYVYRWHDSQSLLQTAYQDEGLYEQFFAELDKLYAQSQYAHMRRLIAYWQIMNMWAVAKIISYRVQGYWNKRKGFYRIARRFRLKRKCLGIRRVPLIILAVKWSILTYAFLPLYVIIRTAGRSRHWEREFGRGG